MTEKHGHISNIMKKKVVSIENLPVQVPVFNSLTLWLALDHWNAPQYMYYALVIFTTIMWTSSIRKIVNQRQINIFKDE